MMARNHEYDANYRADHREALRAKQRAYVTANREAILARAPEHQARYKAKHPDRVRETGRAACAKSRAAHPDDVRAWQAKYRASHPDVRRVLEANRRAREQMASGSGISQKQWLEVLRGALGLCAYCNERKRLSRDHIVPLSRGGEHDITNVAVACKSCNSSKHNASLLVWLARRRLNGGRA